MIRARALADLFTDNIDTTASSIFLFTTGGHLSGKDAAASNTTTKQLACLGALGWRVNTAIMRGEDPSRAARTQSPKILKQVENEGRQSLKSMVFELDGRAVALEFVKEGLLVGVRGFEIGLGGGEDGKEVEDGEHSEHGEDTEDRSDSSSNEARSEPPSSSSSSSEEPPSSENKTRLLEQKAISIAEHLRTELQDFSMPSGMK